MPEQRENETKHQFDRRVRREEAIAAAAANLETKYPGRYLVREVRGEIRITKIAR
jgi:hypothetical protein